MGQHVQGSHVMLPLCSCSDSHFIREPPSCPGATQGCGKPRHARGVGVSSQPCPQPSKRFRMVVQGNKKRLRFLNNRYRQQKNNPPPLHTPDRADPTWYLVVLPPHIDHHQGLLPLQHLLQILRVQAERGLGHLEGQRAAALHGNWRNSGGGWGGGEIGLAPGGGDNTLTASLAWGSPLC